MITPCGRRLQTPSVLLAISRNAAELAEKSTVSAISRKAAGRKDDHAAWRWVRRRRFLARATASDPSCPAATQSNSGSPQDRPRGWRIDVFEVFARRYRLPPR